MAKKDINISTIDTLFKDNIFFKSLATSISQIVSFIDPENFQIVYINKVDDGYQLNEVIGKNIFDYISKEHQDIYRSSLERVKSVGESITIEIAFLTYHESESVIWKRVTITNINDSLNQLVSLMIISEDISKTKMLKIEKDNESERLKAIINNTTDIIFSIDKKFNIIEFNTVFRENVFNTFKVELQKGMGILQFIEKIKQDKQIENFKKVLKGKRIIEITNFTNEDGEEEYYETSLHPIHNIVKKITGISIFSKNITDRVLNDLKIKLALKEKEVLLVEIHHRIKNNLAMVSSLLQLQEMNIDNQEAKQALLSSQKRIKSTALIHELLYKNESFSFISIKEFIYELFNLLKFSNNFHIDVSGEDVKFNLTSALPLGLLLNEIMLNSFKHSFNNVDSGKIEINIQSMDLHLNIIYYDSQGEFPENVDFQNTNSTGLMIIQTFIEQLNGTIELINRKPPKYKIQIPLNEES